jgi:hypothetical protein
LRLYKHQIAKHFPKQFLDQFYKTNGFLIRSIRNFMT